MDSSERNSTIQNKESKNNVYTNDLQSLENDTIQLNEFKEYLKNEKKEFMEHIIPIFSINDLRTINKNYINKKVVNDLYTKSKEFEQNFFHKIQKYEATIAEKECKLDPLEYDKKKVDYIRVTKANFLKRFYNIYSTENRPNTFYKLHYELEDLISLEEKWDKLGKEISKVLFTGRILEYIVTDDNITECDFFKDPPNIRYWSFRFHLFHNLRKYLKKGELSNPESQYFFHQEERTALVNELLKKNDSQKEEENMNKDTFIQDSEINNENEELKEDNIPSDFQKSDKPLLLDSEDVCMDDDEEEEDDEKEEHDDDSETKNFSDEKTNGDTEYYNGTDDEILLRNELELIKNLNHHKNNNIIKNTILNDFKPIYLTDELWFSVTPEDISLFMADYCHKKMSNNGTTKLKGIAMDITGGSGLDSISLSRYWPKVIAVDINMENLYSSFKNAQNYNVVDKISFIHNDFNDPVFFTLFKKIYKGKVDFIYSSPPWSGPSYGELKLYDVDEHLGMDGLTSLLRKTLQLTNNCCFFLPKNSSVNQIMTIARFHFQKTNPPVKIIYASLKGKTKGALVLFGKKLASE
ncbi:hypothetical protein ACO0SA_000027 [Hanseniaspora valbyensis]